MLQICSVAAGTRASKAADRWENGLTPWVTSGMWMMLWCEESPVIYVCLLFYVLPIGYN